MKTKSAILSGIATGLLSLLPISVKAECLRGPNLVVNRGHGASITFSSPVYQAKIFDISKVMLSEIPETGSQTLILTAVESQNFPGLPSTPQTTLLAVTEEECYLFQLTFGSGNFHASVSADGGNPSDRSLLAGDSGFVPLNLDDLRAGLDKAVAADAEGENTFLQRVNQFLVLVDEGVGQRVAAQRLDISWEHLTLLSRRARLEAVYEDSILR